MPVRRPAISMARIGTSGNQSTPGAPRPPSSQVQITVTTDMMEAITLPVSTSDPVRRSTINGSGVSRLAPRMIAPISGCPSPQSSTPNPGAQIGTARL